MKGINRFLIVALVFVLAAVFTVTSPSITYAYDDYSYDDNDNYDYDEDEDEDNDYNDYSDYSDYSDYEYYNKNYHRTPDGDLEAHAWDSDYYDEDEYDVVTKKASLDADGKCIENCYLCGGSRTVTYAWCLDEPDSKYYKSYNVIDHSIVYRNSKSITVWLDNAKKGSVIKVKIGKKTYSKKVGTKKKVKIKIKKKPKYGNKVSIKVYYKGKIIGKSYWWDEDSEEYELESGEIVYYARKIKKGLTKKQVKYLYEWGRPSRTASASGGWSFWYYDDGSYIDFKKGKVEYWYDAAG